MRRTLLLITLLIASITAFACVESDVQSTASLVIASETAVTGTVTATATALAATATPDPVVTSTATPQPTVSATPILVTPTPIVPAPTPTATAAPVPSPQIVTLGHNGSTIELRVGERFLLQLGDTMRWSVEIADQSVVGRVPTITVAPGAQGVFEAKRVGETDLTAVGSLPCHDATPPCMAPSLLFQVHIRVVA